MKKQDKGKSAVSQGGMTIIELMIVIAIVAILVAIAVPAYKDYTIRSKVAECIDNAAVAKLQVSEYYQSLGAWPPTATEAGIDNKQGSSQFCDGFDSYVSSTGQFQINVNESRVDPILSSGTVAPRLTPTLEGETGIINWSCTLGATSAGFGRYLPSSCRTSSS